MSVLILFTISGLGIAVLVLAKRTALRSRRQIFILEMVSKSDEWIRRVMHEVVHFYAEGKHQFSFFVKKQLPLKSKIYLNKALVYLKTNAKEKLFGLKNVRDPRSLKQPENISEFFKSIAESRGNGELHDEYPTVAEEPEIKLEPRSVDVIVEPKTTKASKPKAVKKTTPRRKRIPVVEVL